LIVTGVLAATAAISLSDSTAGRDATADVVTPAALQRLPWTSTALIGVQDADGALASTVVAVLTPEGRGGTLISISPSADAASGTSKRVRPLGGILAIDGPEAWRAAMEQLTGVRFDVAEVVDQQRFAQLVAPLGDLPIAFPFAFVDGTTGTSYDVGGTVLSAAGAGRVVTVRQSDGPQWQLDAARDAVWEAVADRVGAGIGSLPEGVRFDESFRPAGLDQFLDALFAAPVAFRSLASVQLDPDRVVDQMPLEYADVIGAGWENSVVTLRRAETVMVFASVAPARIGAPLEGPTVRLVSGFIDDDATAMGMEYRSDIIATALDILFFAHANVLSVVDQPGAAVPDRTIIRVADESLIEDVWSLYGEAFGEMQVITTDVGIEGVELEIVLGRDFLRAVNEPRETTTTVASSVP
jgi:hypothetical protein